MAKKKTAKPPKPCQHEWVLASNSVMFAVPAKDGVAQGEIHGIFWCPKCGELRGLPLSRFGMEYGPAEAGE